MHYFLSETAADGSVYSCDKLCILGKVDYLNLDTFSNELSMFLIRSEIGQGCDELSFPFGFKGLVNSVYYERFGGRYYRNNFELKLSDGSSFYFGYKHNSQIGKVNDVSWKIELNPNKCLPCDFVDSFIKFVFARSKPISIRISQLDIAIDINVERSFVYLQKDRRVYTRIDYGSDNITEYLSKHNEHGFVKLYNKSKESKLDYLLTRLEITLKDFSLSAFQKVFPVVHIYNEQVTFSENSSSLSHNDEIFVELLRLHPDCFNRLTSRKKLKFKPYIEDSAPILKPDLNVYVNLIEGVRDKFYVSK